MSATVEKPIYYHTPSECPNCGRCRVQGPGSGAMADGVCEKCGWDVDGDDYSNVTRADPTCVHCRSPADPQTGACENWLFCDYAK